MDARSLRDKYAKQEQELLTKEFVAPYAPKTRKVFIKLHRTIYPFRIMGHKGAGFGIFRPIDSLRARFIRDADFDQLHAYLNLLPKVLLILAYETDQGWVAVPFNRESASKTIGLESEVTVRCVSDCERFDVIVARFDSLNFWYDEPFSGSDLQRSAALRACLNKDSSSLQMRNAAVIVKGVTPEDIEAFDLAVDAWARFKVISTEDQ
jgi:hypothetical protein